METISTISRTELARNTRQAIERVRRGETILVKSFGDEQVAIMDVIDYRLLRAVASYRPRPTAPVQTEDATPAGLDAAVVQEAQDRGGIQFTWNLVINAYMDGDISLGRAAELLGLNRFDFVARCNRLGLPMRRGPKPREEAISDWQALEA